MIKKFIAVGMLLLAGMLQAQTLIHYWHFNNMPSGAVDSVAADFSLINPAPNITYPGTGAGFIDRNTGDGSTDNARMGEGAGASLRARNPSDTRDLMVALPTTGFEDVVLKYEVYRSNNGQLLQIVSYTLDGSNFILADTISVGTSYATYTFDFTTVTGANNNPDFAVRIQFDGQNTGTAGNNRFDNFTLEGEPLTPIQNREVTFEITDGANPLVGASVTFAGVTLTTNVIGRALFVVPDGPYTYSVDMAGFNSILNEPVTINSDTTITVALNPPVGQVLHYWHFNNITNLVVDGKVDSLLTDYSISGLGRAMLYYDGNSSGYMDDFNPGSPLNARFGEPAGDALRVRNRSDNRALVFSIPTTNCEDLVFSFDVHRSGSGMLENIVEYTLDGSTYTSASLQNNEIIITTSYVTHSFDFTSITGANNNPNFGIRITFRGNTELENGNNRYDNIVLTGTATGGIGVLDILPITARVYPNPARDYFVVDIQENQKVKYLLIDAFGRVVQSGSINKHMQIDILGLPAGMYQLMLRDKQSSSSVKVQIVK